MANHNYILLVRVLMALLASTNVQPLSGQQAESLPRRIIKWSEPEQRDWINTYISNGMPPGDEIGMLVLNRSAVTLPLLESKIEEIIGSPSPRSLFTNQSADPTEVVRLAAALIASAGNELALREASKLIKVDEKRFGDLVNRTLASAMTRRTAFQVAYSGLALNDPAVDTRIIAWVEEKLGHKEESLQAIVRRWWADAMVDKYDGVPSLAQMANDPIAIRIKPSEYAALEADMRHYVVEAAEKRKREQK